MIQRKNDSSKKRWFFCKTSAIEYLWSIFIDTDIEIDYVQISCVENLMVIVDHR